MITTSSLSITPSLNTDLNVNSNSILTFLELNSLLEYSVNSKSLNFYFGVNYTFITTVFMIAKAPFTCQNLNSTTN